METKTKRSKRAFYVYVSALMAAIAFIGFWPSYFGPLTRLSVDRSAVIHVHAAVYVGWLLLFVVQVIFAARGDVGRHRTWGRFGIGYGVLVVVVGLFTTLYQFAGRINEVGLEASLDYPTWPLIDMAIFAPTFGLAVAYRNKPETHKRLMIVATTTLLIAAAGRMPLPFSVVRVVWFSPILSALVYDLWKQRAVHPVYASGLAVLFVSSFRDSLMQTHAWPSFTRWLGTFFL